MALQYNADLRFLNGLLPVSSDFYLSNKKLIKIKSLFLQNMVSNYGRDNKKNADPDFNIVNQFWNVAHQSLLQKCQCFFLTQFTSLSIISYIRETNRSSDHYFSNPSRTSMHTTKHNASAERETDAAKTNWITHVAMKQECQYSNKLHCADT